MGQRVCFVLQVKPELVSEYRERHQHVWPEMRAALVDSGWRNYSLFLQADGTLIGYFETDDLAAAQSSMASREINTRWQAEMTPFFLSDGPPDAGIAPVPEIFHLA